MRALVLGGTRFLGQALVLNLAKANFQVTVLNRGSSEIAYPPGVTLLEADRHNPSQMKSVLGQNYWDVIYDLICSDPETAMASTELFRDHTSRLVYASSCFVYSYGQNIHEEQFDAKSYVIPDRDLKSFSGTEARRVTEAILSQRSPFKVSAARFPFILGAGDPTQKLRGLIRRIVNKETITIPNASAKFSVISLEDAAKAILRMGLYAQDGAVNCAAELPVSFLSLLKMIEEETYCVPRKAEKPDAESTTVFSLKSDWYVDVSRLRTLDIQPKPARSWLPELIKKISKEVVRDQS
jgi:nucleoside-diphosphate-sugar epimerase